MNGGLYITNLRMKLETLKSRRDRQRPFGEEAGILISNFSLGCRLFIDRWNSSAFSSMVVWR